MAEENDDSQKTEEPSQKKLDDAREKGQVALSREVVTWFMMLAMGATVLFAPMLAARLVQALLPFVEHPHMLRFGGALEPALLAALAEAAIALAPVLALTVAAAVGGTLIQIGFLLAPTRLQPKLEHISPMRGVKRLFAGRAIVEFLKSLLKLTVVAAAAAWLLLPELDRLPLLPSFETSEIVRELYGLSLRLVFGVSAVLAAIAILDYLHQRFNFRRSMRMSKQEVREEYKQVEGDPHVKGKLKQLRAERARRRMIAAVPDATVVVTNPTHFAVALQYELEKSNAPKVVAKGVDRVAQRIREVAKENGVPVVENPPLARTLYAAVDLDEEIPPEHYKAVAEVIGYVLRLQGKLKPRQR